MKITKIIGIFIIWVILGGQLFAQREYSPYVLFHNTSPQEIRQWSGVVINQDNEFFYAISCNHALEDLPANKIDIQATVIPSDNNYPIKFMAIQGFVIKQNKQKDLAYFKFYKSTLLIKPVIIATEEAKIGTKMISYGYSGGRPLIKNPVELKSYNQYMYEDMPVMSCSGKKISGMSGGPVIFENRIYGIQSTANESMVLYIPSVEINKFLKE